MNNAIKLTLTAAECRTVGSAAALRRRMYGLQDADGIADRFARELAGSWREDGVRGVRAACADLATDLLDVPGSYDLYAEARRIGAGSL